MYQPNTPPSDSQIDRSLNLNIIAGFFGIIFFIMVTAGPLSLMLTALGASGMAIGATATLVQLGMLVQIPAAFFAERLHHRKPFWATLSIFARGIWVIPGILILLAPEKTGVAIATTLIVCAIFSFVAQMTSPSWFSWMADLVPHNRRDSFWSIRQGYVMAASLLSVAFIGWFLDLFTGETALQGFAWLLIFSACMGILDVVVHWFVYEPPVAPANRSLSILERIKRPLNNKDFLYFTLAMSLWMFGLGLFGPFTNVYLREIFHISYTHISAIQITNMASGVVASFLAGRFVKRVGIRTFTLTMIVAAPFFSLVWFILDPDIILQLPMLGAVSQPVVLLILAGSIAGGIYANIVMLQFNLLTALAPTEGRTMAMAVHWSIIGLISALGPMAGGFIKDLISAKPLALVLPTGVNVSYMQVIMLLHTILIWLAVFPIFRRLTPANDEWPVDKALLHIFIINPLRGLRNINNLNLIATNKARKSLIHIARKRGKK
jgi:MFS family permease